VDKEISDVIKESSRPKSLAEKMPQIIIYLVTGVLVVLKALGMITLSWWWITLFLWLPIAFLLAFLGIGLLVLIGAFIVFGVISVVESIKS